MIRVIKQELIKPHEINSGEIVTVPDQVQGINEMLQRFRRGEVSTKKSVYNNESELPDLRKLDLTEVDDIKRNLSKNVENGKKQKKSIEDEFKRQKTKQSSNDSSDSTAGAVQRPNPDN